MAENILIQTSCLCLFDLVRPLREQRGPLFPPPGLCEVRASEVLLITDGVRWRDGTIASLSLVRFTEGKGDRGPRCWGGLGSLGVKGNGNDIILGPDSEVG